MPKSLSAQGPTPKPSPHLTKVPDTGYLIPPHVMGRNLDDPTEDVIGTGRKVQRPRLGVRVPYRNLTSQIVTQDEIAQEILQRSLRKNNAPTNAEVKDVFFAMKLTQRLANRLTTSPSKAEEEQVDDPLSVFPETPAPPPQQENKQQASTSSKFDPPPKMDPALERELALKQLNELPSLKKQRRRRCDPGPADHVLIRTNVPEQKPKRKVRKQRGEVDRGIQAGPGALANLKVSVKRKSPLLLNSPTTKKAKPDVKKGLVNGTTQTSPTKTEEEQETERSEVDSPKKRKQHRELDMLLGDEGAVNMIYEAEHGQKQQQQQTRAPRKNRQDMMFKARLVKNAVLRLSSSGPLPSRPRGRRKSTPPTSPPSEPRSPPAQNFNFPPKLAEQSRIIRRHSSDSEFSSRSNSPEPQVKEPLTIIPGPRKKKGVPIFVKKVERTYKGKKKLTAPGEKPKTPKILVKRPAILPVELQKTPPTSPPEKKTSPPSNKNKISVAVKNKLTDEMSRNFQQVVNPGDTVTTPPSVATPPSVTSPPSAGPNRRRKQELESRTYDDAKFILEDDPTLSYGVSWVPVNENWSLEAQIAAVVGEPLEEPEVVVAATTSTVELGVSLEQPDLFAPSTSSGGMMKASPTQSPNSKQQQQRQSVRQSAGNHGYREINLRRYANLVQIILTPVTTKMKNALNVQVLRELKEALIQLKRDEGCRVVLVSSTGSSFCQGIDVHTLIHSNLEKRKKSANELAIALKEFLKALAHFTKPLAAAVHGPAVGLGVTMLPYFDMVFASDKATFYAPYAQLGQVPEGAVALTMPSLLGSNTASELLYCCRKLTATEAHRAGLVTRILWPDRFQEELIPTLCTIAAQSAQAMEGSKLLLRDSLRSNLDAALEAESALLVQHWCSSECQSAYRALLEAEGVGIQKQRTEPVAQ